MEKRSPTLIFGWTDFCFDHGCLSCGSVPMSFCNVTRFISAQRCIHLTPGSCIMG